MCSQDYSGRGIHGAVVVSRTIRPTLMARLVSSLRGDVALVAARW